MKKEIEVKILNIDPKKLGNTIKKLGGKKILHPTILRELYFESPSKKRMYSSFRLRSEGKENLLTLKVRKEDKLFEMRNEYEIVVSSFDVTQKILELAGFKVFRQREKIRESYQLGTIRIEIDTYPGMKSYAEIEATNKNVIKQFIKKIGFSFQYTTKKTATEVIRSAGLNPDNLVFSKK